MKQSHNATSAIGAAAKFFGASGICRSLPASDENGADTFLPIDSKFPMEDYVRLCDAAGRADRDGVEAARKALEARVRDEAKAVRKYINEPLTTPFAILYLATEGLYAEITSSRSGLF